MLLYFVTLTDHGMVWLWWGIIMTALQMPSNALLLFSVTKAHVSQEPNHRSIALDCVPSIQLTWVAKHFWRTSQMLLTRLFCCDRLNFSVIMIKYYCVLIPPIKLSPCPPSHHSHSSSHTSVRKKNHATQISPPFHKRNSNPPAKTSLFSSFPVPMEKTIPASKSPLSTYSLDSPFPFENLE